MCAEHLSWCCVGNCAESSCHIYYFAMRRATPTDVWPIKWPLICGRGTEGMFSVCYTEYNLYSAWAKGLSMHIDCGSELKAGLAKSVRDEPVVLIYQMRLHSEHVICYGPVLSSS